MVAFKCFHFVFCRAFHILTWCVLCFWTKSTCKKGKMQCTPESNIYTESRIGKKNSDNCSDSGYSGLFHSPVSISGADSCKSLSPGQFIETSKENLRPSVTPKERTTKPFEFLGRDHKVMQQPSTVSWCETPKRDSSLRHRLLICRPNHFVKTDNISSPCSTGAEAYIGVRSEHWLSLSFDSLDSMTGALDTSALKSEQDLPLSCRKRRLLFTQMRTSTLDNGKINSDQLSNFGRLSLSDAEFSENISATDQSETPHFYKILPTSKGRPQSPISSMTKNLYVDSSVLYTPSSTHTPKYIR